MCILCGEFDPQKHWTEKPIEDAMRAPESAAAREDEARRYRRRERVLRTAVADKVLCFYGLKVAEWSGSKYVLKDGKGRSEIVLDLGSLWPAAQKLAGKPLDPLDPALQNALTRKG